MKTRVIALATGLAVAFYLPWPLAVVGLVLIGIAVFCVEWRKR